MIEQSLDLFVREWESNKTSDIFPATTAIEHTINAIRDSLLTTAKWISDNRLVSVRREIAQCCRNLQPKI